MQGYFRFDTFFKVSEWLSTTTKIKKSRFIPNFLSLLFVVEKWTVRRGLYKLVEALTLPTTTSGLAQRRLSLHVLRATSVRVRTTLSAGLLPPLRQTAR